MTKDEAEAIRVLANQLLEEDVSVETRQRIARRIITHARAITAVCMAEPQSRFHNGGPIKANPGFIPVRIKYADWWKAGPEHDGERILWADGSLHGVPEIDSEYITVLRRVDTVAPANYG